MKLTWILHSRTDENFVKRALEVFSQSQLRPTWYANNYSASKGPRFDATAIPKIIQKKPLTKLLLYGTLSNQEFFVDFSTGLHGLDRLSGEVQCHTDGDYASVIETIKQLCIATRAAHAWIGSSEEEIERNYIAISKPLGDGSTRTELVRRGNYLDDGLPGMYWINIFGKEYLNFFGLDKLSSCPCHHFEKLNDDFVLLQLYHSPGDFLKQQDLHARAIQYLGSEAFFDKNLPESVLSSAGVVGAQRA